MSRKGNCLDNAVMENFFGQRKSEHLYLQDFDSFEHFKAELVEYFDYYNNRRIKLKLKGQTPAQHRYQTLQTASFKKMSNFGGTSFRLGRKFSLYGGTAVIRFSNEKAKNKYLAGYARFLITLPEWLRHIEYVGLLPNPA